MKRQQSLILVRHIKKVARLCSAFKEGRIIIFDIKTKEYKFIDLL